jgi:polysaccharide biosynthesis/export protein
VLCDWRHSNILVFSALNARLKDEGRKRQDYSGVVLQAVWGWIVKRQNGRIGFRGLVIGALVAVLAGCSSYGTLPPAQQRVTSPGTTPEYLIGPTDTLNVFVWRNPDLTTTIPVRPDGRISIPLIEDLQAAGKTPTALARDVEKELKKFIQEPIVTVIVTSFVGPFTQQIRVVGEAARPQAIPYRENMTVLDVMIQVGGLTQFASGNRAVLVRTSQGSNRYFQVLLDDLLKDGKVEANVEVLPGDVLIIPQSWF